MTQWALQEGMDLSDASRLSAMAEMRAAEAGRLALADETAGLWTQAVGRGVSLVSRVSGVRRALVAQQQLMAEESATVMVGRDIGTVVLPKAAKVYLDAPAGVRIGRRRAQIEAQGNAVDEEDVREELELRDRLDTERPDSPLLGAADAHVVHTENHDVAGVVELVVQTLSTQGQPNA